MRELFALVFPENLQDYLHTGFQSTSVLASAIKPVVVAEMSDNKLNILLMFSSPDTAGSQKS